MSERTAAVNGVATKIGTDGNGTGQEWTVRMTRTQQRGRKRQEWAEKKRKLQEQKQRVEQSQSDETIHAKTETQECISESESSLSSSASASMQLYDKVHSTHVFSLDRPCVKLTMDHGRFMVWSHLCIHAAVSVSVFVYGAGISGCRMYP